MSTKNLARTVIEGGRAGYSKWLRRTSSQLLRVNNRKICKILVGDPEVWDDIELPILRSHWYEIAHADKINPCKRFLASRADRPWNDVHSEICRRFDRETQAGRHIANDHLIGDVDRPFEDPYPRVGLAYLDTSYRRGAWVDKNGILRYND